MGVQSSAASLKRDCTSDEVWSTTDTTQAFGPITARRYGADYHVNAISGRGIVRNYNGGAGATLLAAYSSTPLNPEGRWKSREDLRSDYQATYFKFIQKLRSKHRDALFILWATDGADGEVHDWPTIGHPPMRSATSPRV